ncbi:hypothetical protein H113_07016 [Trichophyton rubrum MR1459]|uniref:Uncharacterized protein n=1 Tax=Trichophyton rubrum TaxID=5551 RepID=A0A178F0E0_TRIRU|nr:hypothetical protein H102_06941 [Trichophyton rubrum CBS 100081]EZF92091.1 hypothetical protein H113_07016 [Trichophyton rubrum MR1459]OAL65689.1 hypothetical protein A7C99_2787 [Trichophyton rubrum]
MASKRAEQAEVRGNASKISDPSYDFVSLLFGKAADQSWYGETTYSIGHSGPNVDLFSSGARNPPLFSTDHRALEISLENSKS